MAIYQIRNDSAAVSVDSFGAQLMSVRGADGTEYLWQGDERYWKDRALTIFPYVARLNGGEYELEGKRYSMAIHGLAPYSDFAVISHSADEITLELTDSEESRRSYPYRFSFQVVMRLEKNTLVTEYIVRNLTDRTMLFGMGGHPGFNVPLGGDGAFEDYRLRFSEECTPSRVDFDAACLRTGGVTPYPLQDGRILPLSHSLFDDDAIVLEGCCRKVTLESKNGGHSVEVAFPDMPYLGIWHKPHSDAPYVCIEPWSSLPALGGKTTVFEEQSDLLSIGPEGSYKTAWTITVE